MLIIPGRETNRRMQSFHAQGKCNKKLYASNMYRSRDQQKPANVFCKCGLHCKCFTASTNVVFIANANVVFIESVSLQVFHYKVFHCKCFITNVSLQVFFHCKCFSLQGNLKINHGRRHKPEITAFRRCEKV